MITDTVLHAPADAGTLFELIGGVTRYWVVVAALDIGLFDALLEGAATTTELAVRCHAEPRRLAVVCDVLADAGLLERAAGAWTLSSAARAHLVSTAPGPLDGLLVHGPGRAANLIALSGIVRGSPPPQPVDDDDAFWRAMFAATLAPQRQLARSVTPGLARRPETVLELGPCAGAWAIELLAGDPHAQAAVECRPAVLPDVRDVAAAAGVGDRLTGSVIAPGAFDVVILANALRVVEAGAARQLIATAVARSRRGATVIVADYFVDAPGRAGGGARLMAATVLANTRAGGALRADEVSAWLAAAGCTEARLVEPMVGFAAVIAERRAEGVTA